MANIVRRLSWRDGGSAALDPPYNCQEHLIDIGSPAIFTFVQTKSPQPKSIPQRQKKQKQQHRAGDRLKYRKDFR